MLLLTKNIMLTAINTVKDLNMFVMLTGISDPDKIISHLADKKLIVSNEMMKLITTQAKARQ